MLLFLISGIALTILAGFYLMTQVFQMVKIDAYYRGIKHPKFWAFLASTGQRGDGLILYLLKRRNFQRETMSDKDFLAFQSYKGRALVALIFQLVGAAMTIIALILYLR
ncbi:hypothetical protein BN1356_00273 [Streptococcus varani]|uniref:DUF3899 domain-containing protein n=1 Tax=Streptococcus varani TaxID=1608583 RepID=A0A0E4CRY2_9STRE|nr:hypothetical protein [Streptococcus varani]CQR23907.1 hypothetical protein BN1356_00273 [Streptococcus varani]